MTSIKHWALTTTLILCLGILCASCSNNDNPPKPTTCDTLADLIWSYSQTHPDGFTLNIHTMTEPKKGIAVSYAATQNSHSREQLNAVIEHAIEHEGYVGGWLDTETGLYYFDSTRLFPEDSLNAAIQFGRDNGQQSIYIISTGTDIRLDSYTEKLRVDL